MSAGGTCEVGFVQGDPPSVVVLGVAVVDGTGALWVAPSEVLGGMCCTAALVDVYLHGGTLGVG